MLGISSMLLRWFGRGGRRGAGDRPGAARRRAGGEVLSLVAFFGAMETGDPHRHATEWPRSPSAARSADALADPVSLVRSTFPIHWEPMDRGSDLIRDVDLSDGWIRIVQGRSAT